MAERKLGQGYVTAPPLGNLSPREIVHARRVKYIPLNNNFAPRGRNDVFHQVAAAAAAAVAGGGFSTAPAVVNFYLSMRWETPDILETFGSFTRHYRRLLRGIVGRAKSITQSITMRNRRAALNCCNFEEKLRGNPFRLVLKRRRDFTLTVLISFSFFIEIMLLMAITDTFFFVLFKNVGKCFSS